MKSWFEYLKLRENEESAPINPSDNDEEGALFRLTRLAWKNHRDDTQSFFRKLSVSDPEIASEYERLGDVEELPKKKTDLDKDQILPSVADTGVGQD